MHQGRREGVTLLLLVPEETRSGVYFCKMGLFQSAPSPRAPKALLAGMNKKPDLDLNDLGRGWVRRNRAVISQRPLAGNFPAFRFSREVHFAKRAFSKTRILVRCIFLENV